MAVGMIVYVGEGLVAVMGAVDGEHAVSDIKLVNIKVVIAIRRFTSTSFEQSV